MGFCEACYKKQLKIDKLENELENLKAQLKYRKKKDMEPFGSSTPSSKVPLKENTDKENKNKSGGAKEGHVGNGRKSINLEEADEIIDYPVEEDKCPDCGGSLELKEINLRSVVDTVLNKVKSIVYRCEAKRCVDCKKIISKPLPVLPKNKYGNALIAVSLIMHYFHGIPLKRVEEIWGNKVIEGNIIKTFHRLAKAWEPVVDKLKMEYRQHPVKHADETGWRTNGQGGYSWLFATENISIFAFKNTRSARIPNEIFGTEALPGVLVVDRYGGYNKVPCDLQYCYAHLLRKLEDIQKEYQNQDEVQRFSSSLIPLLSEAMHLRSQPITDNEFYKKVLEVKNNILLVIRAPAKHLAIRTYQDIFRDNEHRLFHWVKDRKIPADNNRAERELRPTVIARKVSFGSQSAQGAATRSTLMSIIHTAAKRLSDSQTLEDWLLSELNAFAANPAYLPVIPK